jgi:CDP-diacylglycerol--glycerol-3-phosphate 3-phosphatidyltransferase
MNKKIIKAKRLISWPRIINGLTISRILLGLPIIISLRNGNNNIFILLILIAGLTDFLDGYFARKYDHQTALGAKLDPLADKILLLGPMIWLVHEKLVPVWAIWLVISRELLITNWRSDKTSGGPASIQGKYKTTLQFTSIVLLLWPKNWGTVYSIYIINKIGYISFWIAFFLTLSSAIKYLFNQKEADQN